MANRKFFRGTSFCSLERELCFLFAALVVGAAGAVSSFKGLGFKSATKEAGDGKYTIELDDSYFKILKAGGTLVASALSGVASIEIIGTPATFQDDFKGSKTFVIQCLDAAGAAVNPASGTLIQLDVVCRNSSQGPLD